MKVKKKKNKKKNKLQVYLIVCQKNQKIPLIKIFHYFFFLKIIKKC